MNDIINYLIEKLEEDLTKEDTIYIGNVLFSDLDRLCEEVVKFSPNRPDLYKNIYRLNTYVNLNWENQHFDLVKEQTRELIELVRKEYKSMNDLLSIEALNWLKSVNYTNRTHEERLVLIKTAKILFPNKEEGDD